MDDILDTVENAIAAVAELSSMPILWESDIGIPLGNQSEKFPNITISNERPSVEMMNIDGSMRVSYPISICIRYNSSEARQSKAREAQLLSYEKACRAIVWQIGYAHTQGTTSCEIVEDSITQRSSSGSLTNVLETTITFNLAFDEGGYNG